MARARVREFEDHLAGKGRSLSTIKDYRGVVERLERWCAKRGATVDGVDPYMFLRYVEREVPLTRSSRRLLRDALREYWEMVERGDDAWQGVRVPKSDGGLCRALEPDDARVLYKAACRWDDGPEGVAVLLGIQQGMRRGEIAGLRWDGVGGGYDEVSFVGKGPKERMMPLHPVVGERLRWWRKWGSGLVATDCRTKPGSTWVFEGRGGYRHVNPTTVWTWVRKLGGVAGIDVTTHQLRHTFGAEANDTTRDLRATQDLLGHTRVTTTQRYTRVTWTRMQETLMAVDYEVVS